MNESFKCGLKIVQSAFLHKELCMYSPGPYSGQCMQGCGLSCGLQRQVDNKGRRFSERESPPAHLLVVEMLRFIYVSDITNGACPLLFILFFCLFLSSWLFQLDFIA